MTEDKPPLPKPPAPRRRIGRVIAGSGAQHLVLVERDQDGARPLCAGDVLVVGVGRIDPLTRTPSPLCVGAVTSLTVPAPQVDGDADEIRIAEVDLYGTLDDSGFSRGVDRAPALGDAVCLASSADLDTLYAGGGTVGTLTGQTRQAATVNIEALRQGFGVIGCPRAGKSATLAVLTRALLRARAGTRPVLLDVHNEYAQSFGRAATVVEPAPGFIPHWLLTFDELCWALSLSGGSMDDAERSLLAETVPAARIRMMQRMGETAGGAVGVNTPLPYRMTDATSFIDRSMQTDNGRHDAVYGRLRRRLAAANADQRLACVFGNVSATDTLPSLLSTVFGMADGATPMTIVQLGSLGLGLDRLVAGVLCRLARAVGEGTGGRERVLMLIEDAERFVPEGTGDGRGINGAEALSRTAILELAASADASGTALGLVTARPGLVDEQALRALPTLFVHRLPSEAERERVSMVLPEGSAALVAGAGTQRVQDCVVLGSGVPAPGRYTIAALPDAAVPRRVNRAAPNLPRSAIADTLIARWRYGEAVGVGSSARVTQPGRPSAFRSVPAA